MTVKELLDAACSLKGIRHQQSGLDQVGSDPDRQRRAVDEDRWADQHSAKPEQAPGAIYCPHDREPPFVRVCKVWFGHGPVDVGFPRCPAVAARMKPAMTERRGVIRRLENWLGTKCLPRGFDGIAVADRKKVAGACIARMSRLQLLVSRLSPAYRLCQPGNCFIGHRRAGRLAIPPSTCHISNLASRLSALPSEPMLKTFRFWAFPTTDSLAA